MIGEAGTGIVEIRWVANPFRGDRFEQAWLPACEAALDYGAHSWSFVRSLEDPLAFTQFAAFPDKLSFERYWYSEEIAEARAEATGLFQVPVLPVWYGVVGTGTLEQQAVE